MRHFELTRWGEVENDYKADLLYLDFDSPRIDRSYFDLCSILRLIGLQSKWTNYRRTRSGWHVIIKLRRPLHILETVALQAILGSDYKREALNLLRARAILKGRYSRWAVKKFNLLFRSKISI